MNKNLLIIGAGCCGLAARETAQAMGCFENIAFLDDNIKEMPDGKELFYEMTYPTNSEKSSEYKKYAEYMDEYFKAS